MNIRLPIIRHLYPVTIPKIEGTDDWNQLESSYNWTNINSIFVECWDFARIEYPPHQIVPLIENSSSTEFIVNFNPLEPPRSESVPVITQHPTVEFHELLSLLDIGIIDNALNEELNICDVDIGFTADNELYPVRIKVLNDLLQDGICAPEIEIDENAISDGLCIPHAEIIDNLLQDGICAPEIEIDENAISDSLCIPHAEIIDDIAIETFYPPPEIVTPFEFLDHATVLGKSYKEPEHPFNRRRNGRSINPLHGYQRSRNRRGTTAIHDLFEQLRYILQPPIFKPDGQLTIFPNGLKPYPFQIAGVKWLTKRKSALLADQMGLGKTIQSVIAMRVLFRNAELQSALVVCPASMRSVWEREIQSWAPELRPIRVQGNQLVRQDAWDATAQIYIVSYESLARDAYDLASDRFDLCILDEAQKIKNPATLNHKAVLTLTPKYRWALTGTPIENSVEDVVSIFNFLKPDLFEQEIYISANNARQKIAPYLLRRTIEDVQLDLPEVFHQNHWLELHPRQRSAYEQMELHGVADIKRIGEEATRIHILALITRLKQICNYDDLSRQSCKLDFLADNLEDLVEDNDKALVFSQYVQTLRKIEPTLQRFKPLTYEGSLTSNKRDLVVSNFQEKDENMVLLMSVRAGGMGLTLTRANHVFHFDHWWNPAIVDQASARVRRIGQKKPVFVHSLYASNTIEERIFNLLEKKRALFQKVFGKEGAEIGDKELGRLSDEDLFGLFGLKPNTKDNAASYTASRIATQRRHNGTQKDNSTSYAPSKLENTLARQHRPSINTNVTPLSEMSPKEFEEAVCTLFGKMGYRLTVTGKSHDGGIDLDGVSMGLSGGRIVVQCKRYKGAVPVSMVRDLFGVVSSDNNIERGFLVTTGKFSHAAWSFARDKRITLIEGYELEVRFASTIPAHQARTPR